MISRICTTECPLFKYMSDLGNSVQDDQSYQRVRFAAISYWDQYLRLQRRSDQEASQLTGGQHSAFPVVIQYLGGGNLSPASARLTTPPVHRREGPRHSLDAGHQWYKQIFYLVQDGRENGKGLTQDRGSQI